MSPAQYLLYLTLCSTQMQSYDNHVAAPKPTHQSFGFRPSPKNPIRTSHHVMTCDVQCDSQLLSTRQILSSQIINIDSIFQQINSLSLSDMSFYFMPCWSLTTGAIWAQCMDIKMTPCLSFINQGTLTAAAVIDHDDSSACGIINAYDCCSSFSMLPTLWNTTYRLLQPNTHCNLDILEGVGTTRYVYTPHVLQPSLFIPQGRCALNTAYVLYWVHPCNNKFCYFHQHCVHLRHMH